MINNTPEFHVIILAAGTGNRFGGETPKQYLPLNGKPVLRHSIDTFQSIKKCKSIQVVINEEHLNLYQNSVKNLNLPPPINGGKERNISVFNALKNIANISNKDLVLVHDAARPCVSKDEILNLLAAMNTEKAASLATPVTATLRKGENDYAGTQISREALWAMQTPQAFYYGDLLKAHEASKPGLPYTDDTSLISEFGITVKIIRGASTNIKITTLEDFKMAEKILSPSMTILSGTGFDVHAFDTEKAGPVKLCGIDVQHNYALKGHSDADVGLHALTDAIYGAIGEGDIGIHFPPSNPDFKNMDSVIFLQHALEEMADKQGQLQNIDLTLICEEPKIGPYAPQMKQRIADICGLSAARVNIKATTTEKLGFTGRKEGIAAQALVTVRIPDEI